MFAVHKILPNQILVLSLMSLLGSLRDKDIFLAPLHLSPFPLTNSSSPHQNHPETNETTPTCYSPCHLQPLTLDTALLHFRRPSYSSLGFSSDLPSLRKSWICAEGPWPSCPIPSTGRWSSNVLPQTWPHLLTTSMSTWTLEAPWNPGLWLPCLWSSSLHIVGAQEKIRNGRKQEKRG